MCEGKMGIRELETREWLDIEIYNLYSTCCLCDIKHSESIWESCIHFCNQTQNTSCKDTPQGYAQNKTKTNKVKPDGLRYAMTLATCQWHLWSRMTMLFQVKSGQWDWEEKKAKNFWREFTYYNDNYNCLRFLQYLKPSQNIVWPSYTALDTNKVAVFPKYFEIPLKGRLESKIITCLPPHVPSRLVWTIAPTARRDRSSQPVL